MENLIELTGPSIASLSAFFSVVLACAGVYLIGSRSDSVRRRLHDIQSGDARLNGPARRDGEFLVRFLEPAGGMILPHKEWRRSMLRSQLVFAGYRGTKAIYIYLGIKLTLGLALPLLVIASLVLSGNAVLIFQAWTVTGLVMAGAVGFVLPDQVMRIKTSRRRREFTEGFPDALDMMVVCVEAGLGLDAAINRVAKELHHSYPALAGELSLNSLEVRAGKSRHEAFHSLAERMNVDEMRSLSAILIQAERFGTSIASALRNFAEDLRIERIQRARETAAKLPVKMIFPIVLCIFPALFLVLLGPAIVRIVAGLG